VWVGFLNGSLSSLGAYAKSTTNRALSIVSQSYGTALAVGMTTRM